MSYPLRYREAFASSDLPISHAFEALTRLLPEEISGAYEGYHVPYKEVTV